MDGHKQLEVFRVVTLPVGYDLYSPRIVIIRLTHSQEPYTPVIFPLSASAATRRSFTIQLPAPEVRTGMEKKRSETGFSKFRTQNSMLNHALKDEPETACLSSSPQLFCQCRSCWHLLLSASTPLCSKMFILEVSGSVETSEWAVEIKLSENVLSAPPPS